MQDGCVRVDISLPRKLLKKLDEKAKEWGIRRSKYLQHLIIEDLKEDGRKVVIVKEEGES